MSNQIEGLIPTEILKEFLNFVNTDSVTTKKYYSIDKETGIKELTKVVEESRPRDLKQAINFYEKMYPQYFDPLTREKLLALQQATGSSDTQALSSAVIKMFANKPE